MADPSDHPDLPHGPPSASAPPAPLGLPLVSDPAQLAPARRAIEAFCMACGLGAEGAADVGLAVNEAVANVIRHAYGGATDRPIVVRGECEPAGGVRITIRDWGTGATPIPRRGRTYEPGTPGGLGLVCIRGLMDEATYTPQPDGMLLTLVKRRTR